MDENGMEMGRTKGLMESNEIFFTNTSSLRSEDIPRFQGHEVS
jgi:hypothetical protein